MIHTKVIPASHLHSDPDTAAWLFEQAGIDTQLDPLEILMQQEADGEYTFHEEDGVHYPYFAQSHS